MAAGIAGGSRVAPLVGAWIEIVLRASASAERFVAPLVGAWIEIWHTHFPRVSRNVAPLVGAWIEIVKIQE